MSNTVLRVVSRALLSLRYRIRVVGLAELAQKDQRGILFLPNHPALIDPFILFCILLSKYDVRPLAGRGQLDKPGVRWLGDRVRARKIPDATETGADKPYQIATMLRDTVRSLNQGEALVVYPAGRIYQQGQERLTTQGGAAFLTRSCPTARIVLVRTTGLWGSSFSRAGGNQPTVARAIGRGLLGLLKCGVFFMPRREIRLEFKESVDFPRGAGRAIVNRYLEDYYNAVPEPACFVPYSWWGDDSR